MPAKTSRERASTRAYARVHTLLAACIVVPGHLFCSEPAAAQTESTASTASQSTVETRFAKGMALAAADDTAGAIEIFARLAQEYPHLPEPHVQLAALYVKQGENRKALATLRTALALRSDDARIQSALGDLYVVLAARAYRTAMAAGAPGNVRQKASALEQLERGTQAQGTDPP